MTCNTTDHVEAVVTRHAPHSPGGQLGLTASEDAAATCSLAAAAALSSPTRGEVCGTGNLDGDLLISALTGEHLFKDKMSNCP